MASFSNESFDIPAGYAVEKIDCQLYIEDIAEDDEIYLIRTPIDIEFSELDKKKIILPVNSGDVYMKNIKMEDGKVLDCLAETREIPGTCVVLPKKSDGQLHVLNKPLKGSILICESLEEHNDVDIKTELFEEPPESAAVNVKVKSEEQTKVLKLINSVSSSQKTKKKKKKKHFPCEFGTSDLDYDTEDAEYLILPDVLKEQFPKKDTKSSSNIAVNSQSEDCVENSRLDSSLKSKKKSKKAKRHSFSDFDVIPEKNDILISDSLELDNDVVIKTEILEELQESLENSTEETKVDKTKSQSAAMNVKVKLEDKTEVKQLINSENSSQKAKKKKHFPCEFDTSDLDYDTEDAEYLILPDVIKEQFPKKDTKSSGNIAVNSQSEDCVENSLNSSLKTKKKSKKGKRHSFSDIDVSSEKNDILISDSLELDNDVVVKTEILEELQESLENSTEEAKLDKIKRQSAAMNVKIKLEDKTEVKQLINPENSFQKTKKKKNKKKKHFPFEFETSDLNYETSEADHLFPSVAEEQSPKKCSKSSYSTAVNSQNEGCVKNSLKTKKKMKKHLVSDFDVSTNNEMILECVELSNDVDIRTEVLEEQQECSKKTSQEMERGKTKSPSAAGNVNIKSEDKMEVELINPENSSQVPKKKKNKKKKHILCEFESSDLNYEAKEVVHLLPPDVIKEQSPKKNSKPNYNIAVNSQEDCVENSPNSSLKTKKKSKKRKRHSFDVSSEKNDILTLDSLKLDNDVVIKTEVLEELQDSLENETQETKRDQTKSPSAAVNVKVKSEDKTEVEKLFSPESSSQVPKKKKNKKKKPYPLEFEPSNLNYETEDTEHLIPVDVIKEQFSERNSKSSNIEVPLYQSPSAAVNVTVKSAEKMKVKQLINPESSSQKPNSKKHFPLKFETSGLNYKTKDAEHFFWPDVIKKQSPKKHLKSSDNITMNFPSEDCIENFQNCSVKKTHCVSGIDVNTNNNKTANSNNSVDPMKFTRLFEETLKKALG